MYKLITQFAFFRFNSTIQEGPLNVTWYKLEEGNDDEYGKGLTYEELNKLQSFMLNHPDNFPGDKNYHICNDEEAPYCPTFIAQSEKLNLPSNIILRKSPQLDEDGNISRCTDIILNDPDGKDKFSYNLNFDIIGEINW